MSGTINETLDELAEEFDLLGDWGRDFYVKLNGAVMDSDAHAAGDRSVALGQSSVAGGSDSVAVGSNAGADATGSVAIGQNASATGANSVALGAGALADRAWAVSVGSAGFERQIIHVADGTAPTDAVNQRQLESTLASANAYTDAQVAGLGPGGLSEAEVRAIADGGDAATTTDVLRHRVVTSYEADAEGKLEAPLGGPGADLAGEDHGDLFLLPGRERGEPADRVRHGRSAGVEIQLGSGTLRRIERNVHRCEKQV